MTHINVLAAALLHQTPTLTVTVGESAGAQKPALIP